VRTLDVRLEALRLETQMTTAQVDDLCINSIRFLAIDAVQKAKSGHPGTPMGAAPMAHVLWDRFLKHNPTDPAWPNRDRFVLSAGHASMLLYSLLHLTGYDLSIDDIKNFRQWGSGTPGHPELGVPGVEMTTGPLGQGFAHGVGMAIAERFLADHYNRPGHEVIDHYTYAIVSDGDLEEGVASEAASLAGTLKLGKLIYLYDDNGISIEGDTDIAFMENVGDRFKAYGWHVVSPVDGHDTGAVDAAIREAQAEIDLPTLIVCHTIIGFGSPNKANTGGVHGEPLGEDEVSLTRANLGWTHEPFDLPKEAISHARMALGRGAAAQEAWVAQLADYRKEFPGEAAQLDADLSGALPVGWADGLDGLFSPDEKPVATRDASNRVMNYIAERIHGFTGGSADLAPSNKTMLTKKTGGDFASGVDHNMHFGVREHAMGSIAGGMAVHGGVIPYTATFMVFSDYMRPPMRLAALMGLRVIYVFTHDSVGVGEDGPTHQPIEHLMSLRTIPNLNVIRPADGTEAAQAWKSAIERTDGPTALVFTRQGLPIIDQAEYGAASGVHRGAYVLWQSSPMPDVILMGTGSEVPIALEAGKALAAEGTNVRVVSMPSLDLFDAQPQAYRDAILPPNVSARVSIEAGVTLGWDRYIGLGGTAIGINHFGASAPFATIYKEFGLTAERVAEEARKLLSRVN
jgi:transketolase